MFWIVLVLDTVKVMLSEQLARIESRRPLQLCEHMIRAWQIFGTSRFQGPGELYVTKPIFLSDFKLLLGLSASVSFLLYLSLFVNRKMPGRSHLQDLSFKFSIQDCHPQQGISPKFLLLGASTKRLTQRRTAENGSNRDSSEAARSGRAIDTFANLVSHFP